MRGVISRQIRRSTRGTSRRLGQSLDDVVSARFLRPQHDLDEDDVESANEQEAETAERERPRRPKDSTGAEEIQPQRSSRPGAGVAFTPHASTLFEHPSRPEHDEFTQDDVIAGRKTMTIIDQDIHLIRDVQRGMRSRGFRTALLSADESRVQHYHDWLDHVLDVPF